MDRDGTRDGFDLPLTRAVSEAVNVPVDRVGRLRHRRALAEVLTEGRASAALAASIFHFGEVRIARGEGAAARDGDRSARPTENDATEAQRAQRTALRS